MSAFIADEYKDYKNPFYDPTKESKYDPDNLIFENTEKCYNKSRVAYDKKLDLYAMIAQSAYNNEYWENLEFLQPGRSMQIDGKDVYSGTGKEWEEELSSENFVTVNFYEQIKSNGQYVQADQLKVGQSIDSTDGILVIKSVDTIDGKTTIYF